MRRLILVTSCFLAVFLYVSLLPLQARAGTFAAFGPANYLRQTGGPSTDQTNFSVQNPATIFTLHLTNGQGASAVTSAAVYLNGEMVLGPSNFKKKTTKVEIPVILQLNNTLSVDLRGKPGSNVDILIEGEDNDLPSITSQLVPVPNDAGWNKGDVLVTFHCSDQTSGISFCTEPVLVTIEGESQIVTGVAIDLAGNSASLDVPVSLDKTAPEITGSTEPEPNDAEWFRDDVTVSFSAIDDLSGVKFVTQPRIVAEEGEGIEVVGSALDQAGNQAVAAVVVNVDRTPPTLSASYEPSLTNGWAVPGTVVTPIADDALSGVESVSGPVCEGATRNDCL